MMVVMMVFAAVTSLPSQCLQDLTNGSIDLLALDLPWTAFGKGKAANLKICKLIEVVLEKSYGEGVKERSFEDVNMATGLLLQKVCCSLKARIYAGP